MDTLHKIAGVQDAQRSDAASPLPRPTIVTGLTADTSIPPKDREDASRNEADATSIKSPRRASLPLNRRPSHKSFQSGHSRGSRSRNASMHNASRTDLDIPPTPKIADVHGNAGPQPAVPRGHASATSLRPSQHGARGNGDEDYDDSPEFEWGPQHPCFPHPNSHCAPGSEEAQATRVIRVRRDYLAAGDLYPQFANLYPEILDPLVIDSEFRDLISGLNAILARCFSPYTSRAWIDALLGAATGYIWDDVGFTGAKAGEKQLERYIQNWNTEREREGREVRLVQPRTTGYMNLDFVVPDPGIDFAAEDDEDDGQTGGFIAELPTPANEA